MVGLQLNKFLEILISLFCFTIQLIHSASRQQILWFFFDINGHTQIIEGLFNIIECTIKHSSPVEILTQVFLSLLDRLGHRFFGLLVQIEVYLEQCIEEHNTGAAVEMCSIFNHLQHSQQYLIFGFVISRIRSLAKSNLQQDHNVVKVWLNLTRAHICEFL